MIFSLMRLPTCSTKIPRNSKIFEFLQRCCYYNTYSINHLTLYTTTILATISVSKQIMDLMIKVLSNLTVHNIHHKYFKAISQIVFIVFQNYHLDDIWLSDDLIMQIHCTFFIFYFKVNKIY